MPNLRSPYRDDISEDLGGAAFGEKLSLGPKHCWHTDDRTQVGPLLGVRVPGTPSGDQAVCSQRVLVPVSLVDSVPRRGTQDGEMGAVVNHRGLKHGPGPYSIGVSTGPQHGSGTAPPGSRAPEAVSRVSYKKERSDRGQTRKGKGKKGKGQGASESSAARSSGSKSFQEILKDPVAKSFLTMSHQNGKVCWNFQSASCNNSNCARLHADALVAAKREVGTTPVAVRRLASELRLKRFLTADRPLRSIPPVSCPGLAKPRCSELSDKVKPHQQICHILLCSYRVEDGQDVLDAWNSLSWQTFSRCDITHFIFSDHRDLLNIIIPLDQVRHGFSTAVFASSPAATRSRLRNSQVPGQVALRSRQFPLGLTTRSPESRCRVRASNEVSCWFAEQMLRSPQPLTFFLLVFPVDFGSDPSPWSAREFTGLSHTIEAQGGAVCLCRFFGVEYHQSVGLLTNVQALSSDMCVGWPSLNTLDSVIQHGGPLPVNCACPTEHPSLKGQAEKGGFKSFKVQSLGAQLWARILSKIQLRSMRREKPTHSPGRFFETALRPSSTLSSSQRGSLATQCFYFLFCLQPAFS